MGKGSTEHHPEIEPEDLKTLYENTNIETPTGLQQKVWFDILYHFSRRGCEGQRSMTKSTFKVGKDVTGATFVHLAVDEANKNHTAITDNAFDTVGEGRMYALPGNEKCPVYTFTTYLSRLNPLLDALWQRPKVKKYERCDVWYVNSPVGENTLSKMMSQISESCQLSQRYTNHCVRVSTMQAMDRENFEGRDIIRVTGHKCLKSINTYARILTTSKKRKISQTLTATLTAQQTTGNSLTASQEVTNCSQLHDEIQGTSGNIQSEAQSLTSIDMPDSSKMSEVMPQSEISEVLSYSPLSINNLSNSRRGDFRPVFNNCNVTMNVNYGESKQ